MIVASFGGVSTKQNIVQSPSSTINIQFTDNVVTKKEEKPTGNVNAAESSTLTTTQVDEQQKAQPAKPKSYRDAIGKKEKVPTTTAAAAVAATVTNESPFTTGGTAAASASASAASAPASGTKATKSGKQKASKSANKNARAARGHPQDTNEYYDDSYYYGGEEAGYLHTGYVDDQEVFIGNLSAQITEQEVNRRRKFF